MGKVLVAAHIAWAVGEQWRRVPQIKGCRPQQSRDYSMIKLSVIIICVGLNYELVYTLFNGLWSKEIAIMGWEACQENDLFDILWDAITRGLLYKDCYRIVSSLSWSTNIFIRDIKHRRLQGPILITLTLYGYVLSKWVVKQLHNGRLMIIWKSSNWHYEV